MGEWTKAKRDEHKCDYPKFAVPSDTAVGDEWTCECGRVWMVAELKKHPGDTNSPDPRERATVYTAQFTLIRIPG